MSRIGKMPVAIPSDVNATFEDGVFRASGPHGTNSVTVSPLMKVEIKESEIRVVPCGDRNDRKNKAIWGLTRSLINNAVVGVDRGFEKALEIVGVGYRADLKKGILNLQVGYSHPLQFNPPEGIEFILDEPTRIRVVGRDKQLVGEIAAEIRAKKPPEPYKGKGIRYTGEYVRMKAGKSAT